MSKTETTASLAILLKRRAYPLILSATANISVGDLRYFEVMIFRFRALAESGKFNGAQVLCDAVLRVIPEGHLMLPFYKAWLLFLELFTTETDSFSETIADLGRLSEPGDKLLNATIRYLQSRTVSFAMAVGRWPQNDIGHVAGLMDEAAALFFDGGDLLEYGAVKKAAALLYNGNQCYQPAEAVKRLEELQLLPGHPDETFFRVGIKLSIEVIRSKMELNGCAEDKDLAAVSLRFDALIPEFLEIGHPQGAAEVRFEQGLILLDHGYQSGVDCLLEAISLYEPFGEVTNRQAAWKKLADWYQRHGEQELAGDAYNKSAVLDRLIELEMSVVVQAIIEIHLAFMSQPEAEASRLGQHYLAQYGHTRMGPQIKALLANSLSQGKRKHEALEFFREVIADYGSADPSNFLSDAYFNYSNAIFPLDPKAGQAASIAAQGIARRIGDHQSFGKYCRELALNLSQQHRGETAGEISELFERAIAAFALDGRFPAIIEKYNTVQQLGIHFFNSGNESRALTKLQEAAQFYERRQLMVNLAFVQSHIGLLKMQMARKSNQAKLLLQAADHFKASVVAFQVCHGTRFIWRCQLLEAQAIAEYAGLSVNAGSGESYFEQAQTKLLGAANVVDYLKGLGEDVSFPAGGLADRYQEAEGLSADFSKVFSTGFRLNYFDRYNAGFALEWVERNKSRLLMSELWRSGQREVPRRSAEPLDLEQLMATLAVFQAQNPGEKLVFCEYYILDDHIFLFLIKPDGGSPQTFNITASAATLYEKVKALLASPEDPFLRSSFDPLIAPILQHTVPDDLLYVIPHGFLHSLPFQLITLHDGRFLIERNTIAYLPSLTTIVFLQQKASINKDSPLSLRDGLAFGDSRGDLPFAEQEAIYVATLLDMDYLTGQDATKSHFINALGRSPLIHFAGHGQTKPADGLAQCLLFSDNETLSAAELMMVPSQLELIVLSGCETGTLSIQVDTDEIVGFPAAALSAGAMSIITTLWKVDDQATRRFFKYFYESMTRNNFAKAKSLREAMVRMIRLPDAATNDWAAFMFTGR